MIGSKISNYIIFSILFVNISQSHAQVIYETSYKDIYTFLSRLDSKNIIQISNVVRPYSKIYITKKLSEISDKKNKLNSLELEELSWYKRRYSLENNSSGEIFGELNFLESNFKFRVYPIVGYGISNFGNKSGYSRKIGFHLEGYYSNYFGASFEYLDNNQYGENVDRKKNNINETGYDNNVDITKGIEFSDVRGQINLNWDWGIFSLKKDYNYWGNGKYGQLIISDKPASYPHIELRLKPVEWFQFTYIHGWLNSLIVDSSSIHYSTNSNYVQKEYGHFIPKYIVANIATFTPSNLLEFSIGNSFIYSGPLRPEMFMPFMYYKVMDHNTGRGSWGDGNGAIFIDLLFNYPNSFKYYGTLFIDNLDIKRTLNGDWSKTWLAYTIGASAIDLFIDNLDFYVEYSKVNPWLYENQYDVTTYKHLDYILGHWIGQNSDLLSIQLDYKFLNRLLFSLEGQFFRKGGTKDIYFAYYEPKELDFLFNPRRIEKSVKIKIKYELFHNLFISGYYMFSDISDEDISRTLSFKVGEKNSFSLNIIYGIDR